MKKIILIIIILLCTGCFDYKEISDLAIVSSMGIDYIDDEYVITMEVLNDLEKESSAYIKTDSAKTLTEAIDKVSDKLPKQSSFSHMNLLILGKGIIENNLDSIIDLFLRNTYFRESFYIVGTNNTPEELLNNTSKDSKIASDTITRIIENMSYSTNSNIVIDFETFIKDYLDYGKDNVISNVVLDDKDFIIDGMFIFHNLKYQGTLDNDMAKMYNILTNNFKRATFSKEYDNKYFTIGLSDGKIDISIKDKIYITGNIEARILDNNPNFDIRDIETINMLNNDFKIIINDLAYSFVKNTQVYESDVLSLTSKYYQSTRIKNEDIFKNLDIVSNIDFKISKKGLTYDIKK